MLKSYRKKAVQIYKNQGAKGLARKVQTFAGQRMAKARRGLWVKSEPDTLEQKNLREEYAMLSNDIFQISSKDIESSKQATKGPNPKNIKTATWFVPHYDHFGFNGIQTIFRFIEKLSKEGVHNRIVIYDNPAVDVNRIRNDMAMYFPDLKRYEIIVFGEDKIKDIASLPPSDIAFCTMWVSAYVMLRFNQTKRKYYFIQDYEPLFYVAGSTYALAESTYRFGFEGVVNTPGLLAAVNQRHGLEGVSFIPAVNGKYFYPQADRQENERVRICFYARPLNPRNSFTLCILTVKQLLDKYGDKIEIIAAGAEWDEAEYGLKGRITNLGLIKSLEEVADLYRTCDIGFSYMLNKHTTYQFFDYSACGMATVMNENEDHHWLHKHEKNCLIAEPSPGAMAEQIGRLVDDPVFRNKLVKTAQESLGYTWEQQTDMIWNYIKKSKTR